MNSPTPEFVLRGHTSAVNSIKFATANELCSGSLDGTLKVWDLSTRRAKVSMKGAHAESINTVGVTVDKHVVSLGRDGFLKVWDLASLSLSIDTDIDKGSTDKGADKCTPVGVYGVGARHFCNAAIDPVHPHLILTPVADESECALIDKRCPDPQIRLKVPAAMGLGMLTSLLLDGCGSYEHSAVLGFEGGSVISIDLRNYSTPSSSQLSSSSSSSSYDLRRVESLPVRLKKGLVLEPQELDLLDTRPRAFFEAKHGRQPVLATRLGRPSSGGGGVVELYTAGADRTVNKHTIISPQGSSSGGGGHSAGVHNSPKPTVTIQAPSAGTSSLALGPTARLLACGHWDGTARVVECRTMRTLAVLRHHRDCVFAVDFAPPAVAATVASSVSVDGSGRGGGSKEHVLATASKDATVAVWRLFGEKRERGGSLAADSSGSSGGGDHVFSV